MMDRRRFQLTSLAGAPATPLAAGAQPVGKVWRIGWLTFGSGAPRVTFREAVKELGYIEAKNIGFEVGSAEVDFERLPSLAAELVRLKVGGPDLVESGIVATRSRPGGNVTGVDMLNTALDAKRLEFLLEAVPHARPPGRTN